MRTYPPAICGNDDASLLLAAAKTSVQCLTFCTMSMQSTGQFYA